MAATTKKYRGMVTIEVWPKSFRIRTPGHTSENFQMQGQLSDDTAQWLANNINEAIMSNSDDEASIEDLLDRVNSGNDIHEHILEEIKHIYNPNEMINANDGHLCEEMMHDLEAYETWEPEQKGERARRKQAAHLYELLNRAYQKGRLAAKYDTCKSFNKFIMEA